MRSITLTLMNGYDVREDGKQTGICITGVHMIGRPGATCTPPCRILCTSSINWYDQVNYGRVRDRKTLESTRWS